MKFFGENQLKREQLLKRKQSTPPKKKKKKTDHDKGQNKKLPDSGNRLASKSMRCFFYFIFFIFFLGG